MNLDSRQRQPSICLRLQRDASSPHGARPRTPYFLSQRPGKKTYKRSRACAPRPDCLIWISINQPGSPLSNSFQLVCFHKSNRLFLRFTFVGEFCNAACDISFYFQQLTYLLQLLTTNRMLLFSLWTTWVTELGRITQRARSRY